MAEIIRYQKSVQHTEQQALKGKTIFGGKQDVMTPQHIPDVQQHVNHMHSSMILQ